jgi:hypothetical protein
LDNPPEAQNHFNWEWEQKFAEHLTSIPFVKKLIYLESESFHPDEPDQQQSKQQTPTQNSQPVNIDSKND